MEKIAQLGRAAALAILVVTAALLLAAPVLSARALVAKNYNEGWNAFQAVRAFGPEPLYPAPTALITNNYPPLSFYLVGALGAVVGDDILAGRLLSLLGFLSVALAIGAVTRALTGSMSMGLFSSALFVGLMATLHPAYLGMNDPQWLAQAIQSGALVVLLTRPDGRSRLGAVLALTLLAGLVKHNLVALPIALTIQLAVHDRRRAFAWLRASALALLLVAGALYAFYGPDFFFDVFGNSRSYALAEAARKSQTWLLPLLPLFLAFLLFARLESAGPQKTLLIAFVAASATVGALALGGAGVNRNVLDDLVIGLAIVAGLAIHRIAEPLGSGGRRAALGAGLILLCSLGVFVRAPGELRKSQEALASLASRESLVAADVGYLAAVPGPVACEDLALCYWAGKSFEMDFFAVGQKLRSGELSNDAFGRLIESHTFAAIQLDKRGLTTRLPPAANRAIARSYVARPLRSGGVVLVPREARATRTPS